MRGGIGEAHVVLLCALLVGACQDDSTKGKRATIDPVTGTRKRPPLPPKPRPSKPAADPGAVTGNQASTDERLVPSCETANPETPRYREVRLRGEAPHLGALSEPGFFNIIIIGAEWCAPCGLVRQAIPRWLSAYPRVVFTYVDIVDKGVAVSRYSKQNAIETIPYAYLSNECGYGLSWLRSDLEQGQPLDVKIALKLQSIFGPPPPLEADPVPMVQPQLLTMAPPRASIDPGPATITPQPIARSVPSPPSAPKPPREFCHEGDKTCGGTESARKGGAGAAKSSEGKAERHRVRRPQRGKRASTPKRSSRGR